MSTDRGLLVELPESLAADAVRSGIAKRVLRRRSAGDVAVIVLGVGGSLVSLLQTPTTLRDFSLWLTARADAKRERTIVRLARTGDGRTILEVAPGADADTVAKLLKKALDAG